MEGTNSIEIINLQTATSTCEPLTNFPTKNVEAYGVLLPNGRPLICGDGDDKTIYYNNCYTYANNSWTAFPSMTTFRKHAAQCSAQCAAISPALFSSGSDLLLVTGGSGGKDANLKSQFSRLKFLAAVSSIR